MAGNKRPRKKYKPKPKDFTHDMVVRQGVLGELLARKHVSDTSEAENESPANLKVIPHQSLLQLQKREGSVRDWFNIALRVLSGQELAKQLYTQEAVDGFKEAVETLREIQVRHGMGGFLDLKIEALPHQVAVLSDCLECCDRIQDESTIDQVYYGMVRARQLLKVF